MGAIVRLWVMPDRCSNCPFANDEVSHCRLRNSSIIAGKKRNCRMPLCPLRNEGEYLSRQVKAIRQFIDKRTRKMKNRECISSSNQSLKMQDSQIVMLPCKIGDIVYMLTRSSIHQFVVDRIYVLANNELQIRLRNVIAASETIRLTREQFARQTFQTLEKAEMAMKGDD